MDIERLRGVYNITPTPFHPDGELDEESVARLVEFTLARHVDGMTILGVMGEAGKLTDAERDRVVAGTVEAAAGRLPICVGTSHDGTAGCIARSRRAERLGASSLMVAPPRLSRSNDEAVRRHYLEVASAVTVPIVVQDHPPSSGVVMSVELLARLGDEAPACRVVKQEDEPTPWKIGALLAANPSLRIFGGMGGTMLLEELRRGAVGTMTGFGFPELLVEIVHAFEAGEAAAAARAFDRACPLIRFENQPRMNLSIRKHVYHRRGAIGSPCARAPCLDADERTLADLDDLLERLGLTGR